MTEERLEMSEGISNSMSLPPKGPGGLRRRAVTVSSEDLVRFGTLLIGDLPLLAEPASPGVDLAAWAASNRQQIEEKLHR